MRGALYNYILLKFYDYFLCVTIIYSNSYLTCYEGRGGGVP